MSKSRSVDRLVNRRKSDLSLVDFEHRREPVKIPGMRFDHGDGRVRLPDDRRHTTRSVARPGPVDASPSGATGVLGPGRV
ncbi:hypothetical protein BRD17_00580 [Halobacteriales archaeon SW_7_68_16]|nr:MAG: hypothetical protein BRD17_00580 [Halobacteriales archaeon SW_7_68_16]